MADSFQQNTLLPHEDPSRLGLSPAGIRRISEVLQREIALGTMPGAVAMVGRRGHIGYFEAFGIRDPATGRPMARDAIFRIFSMTKPITSIAAMMLAEEGRLLIDAPLSQFIPAYAQVEVARFENGEMRLEPLRREITIQDLLRHTSGLTHEIVGSGPIQTLYADARMARRDRSNEEHAAEIARFPLLCQPGSEWNYSRSVEVLGRVIEIVSGVPLGIFLRERIFEPLGMPDTGFHAHGERSKDRLAQPFPIDPWSGKQVSLFDMNEKPRLEAGGGGLVSTAADYARFAQMLLNGGELDGQRLIGSRTLKFMTADHLGQEVARPYPDPLPPGFGFGLGFAVRRQSGLAPFPGSVGQYFWNGSAGTQFWADPKEELWAILMVQAPGQREKLRVQFRNLVYAAVED